MGCGEEVNAGDFDPSILHRFDSDQPSLPDWHVRYTP